MVGHYEILVVAPAPTRSEVSGGPTYRMTAGAGMMEKGMTGKSADIVIL